MTNSLGSGDGLMTTTLIAAFTIPGEPVSKARARVTSRGTFTPQRTRDAEQAVRDCYRTQCPTTSIYSLSPKAQFELVVDLFMGNRRARDIDNMVKLVQDALNGVAYVDDAQIFALRSTKAFVPKAEARTEVWLYLASEGTA